LRPWARRPGRGDGPWWVPGRGEQHRVSLAVRTLGGRGSPVVLLHGLAGSGRYWGSAYDQLAEGHRLLVPDLLGFGRSPRPAAGYGPDDHADAVSRSIRDLGAHDQRATVVGHSLGSLVALRLAVRHPSLVARVVCFGPPIYADTLAARGRLSRVGPGTRLFGLDTRWAELSCRHLCQRHPALAARLACWWCRGVPRPIAADAVEHSWASYCETLIRVLLTADATAWMNEIDIPIHLVAGAHDRVVDRALLVSLAGRHPNVTFVALPRLGHDAPLADAATCRRVIDEATGPEKGWPGRTRDDPGALRSCNRPRISRWHASPFRQG